MVGEGVLDLLETGGGDRAGGEGGGDLVEEYRSHGGVVGAGQVAGEVFGGVVVDVVQHGGEVPGDLGEVFLVDVAERRDNRGRDRFPDPGIVIGGDGFAEPGGGGGGVVGEPVAAECSDGGGVGIAGDGCSQVREDGRVEVAEVVGGVVVDLPATFGEVLP